MWQVLAVAGLTTILGMTAPTSGVHAAARFDGQAPGIQATSQSGAKPTSQAGADDRRRQPAFSATTEWDWWNDQEIRRQLNLSEDKAKKLQAIFQRRVSEIQPWVDSLNRERDKLNRMTDDRVADELTYSLQVAKVEFLAAKFRESRTIMLYRMFRELQPEQYRKLQEITQQRRDEMLRRGSGAGR